MTRRIYLATVLVMIAMTLGACTEYRGFYTRMANAGHKITIVVSPVLQKVATVENVLVNKKEGAGHGFDVTGDIQYSRGCQILSVNVSFVNTAGVALSNTQAPIMNYAANTKARFMASAYIVAQIGETKDIVDQVVLGSLQCL